VRGIQRDGDEVRGERGRCRRERRGMGRERKGGRERANKSRREVESDMERQRGRG
jgi:hypothetical protein